MVRVSFHTKILNDLDSLHPNQIGSNQIGSGLSSKRNHSMTVNKEESSHGTKQYTLMLIPVN